MAMLAGPRRKQRVINLRAKNSEWSKDANKFGQRMLEKMGWSSGKGLGANENGIVEHVVARYKNDEKGLGFEDKNNQWTKHEDDFNTLLANLSNGGNNDEKKLHSGVSLEVKSKKSKARVHYQKFTRGKDISRYSEKDLANIFGKKTFKKENKSLVPEIDREDIKITEQVFTEKGSMDDYFKNKMAAFKAKSNGYQNRDPISRDCDDEADFAFKGFSTSADMEENSHQGFGFQQFTSSISDEPTADKSNKETELAIVDENQHKKRKKNKKSKKQKKIEVEESYGDDNILESLEVPVEDPSMTNVKKAKKRNNLESEVSALEVTEESFPQKNKSKKKRKVSYTDPRTSEINEEEQQSVVTVEHVPKKKKKKKHQ